MSDPSERIIHSYTPEEINDELAQYEETFGNWVQRGWIRLDPRIGERPPSTMDWDRYVFYERADSTEPIATCAAYSDETARWFALELEYEREDGNFVFMMRVSVTPVPRFAEGETVIWDDRVLAGVGFTLDNCTNLMEDPRVKEIAWRLRDYHQPDLFDEWVEWHSGAFYYGTHDEVDSITNVLQASSLGPGVTIYAGYPREFFEADEINTGEGNE